MSGGGGGPTQSTQTVQQQLSPEQQQLLGLVTPIAANTLNKGVQLYPGSTVAGFTPSQTQAQNLAVQATGQIGNLGNNAANATNFLTSGLAGTVANPALNAATNAATQPIIDAFTQQILPAIRSGAVTAGGVGGSREGVAQGLAAQGTQRAIGETTAPIANDAFLRGLQAQVSALGLVPQTQQSLLAPSDILGAVGQQQQNLAQQQLTEASQKYITDQLSQFELAKQVAGLAFGFPNGGTTATALSPAPTSNPFLGGLGGAASGAAIGSMFGPGYGTAIGAGIGGLLGLFGS